VSTTDRNKPTRKDRLRVLASGVQKHYPNVALILAGRTFQPSELEQAIQQDIDATDATEKARAAWRAQVQAEKDSHRNLAPVLRALRSQIVAQFGDGQGAAGVLSDFGYSPQRVPKKTTATKAAAVDKALATRKARHTMGSKQKKDVHGTVPTAPPAPSPAPSPKPAS
jgi:hypothetical protein